MADVELLPCGECGMPCRPDEYHPFAACLMFKACHNSETVRANLEALRAEVTALQRELGALHMHAKQRDQYAVEKAVQALDWKKRAEQLEEVLRELVEVFSESGMYDEEVFAKARAALAHGDEE